MTTYIPSLTIPSAIFAQPAASILLPVIMSGMVGYACRRKTFPVSPVEEYRAANVLESVRDTENVHGLEAAPSSSSALGFRAGLDGAVCTDGLLGLSCMDHRHELVGSKDG